MDITDRFHAVLAVAARPSSRAALISGHLATSAGLPVTILDTCPGPDELAGRANVLLVVDALGGGPAADALFDPDAERVVTQAHGPVLVVGPLVVPSSVGSRLVVPVDGAGLCAAVGTVVAAWAQIFGPCTAIVLSLRAPDSWPDDGTDPVVDVARAAVVAFERTGIDTTLTVGTSIDAAGGILDVARADDVLVVPSPRHPSRLDHWYSTTRRLVRRAPCPVLVVPVEGE